MTMPSAPPPAPGGVPNPSVRYRVPGPYQPGQPIPPRQRPPTRSPVIAPILALVGLLIIGGASFWGISLLGIDAGEETPGAVAEASAEPAGGTDGGDSGRTAAGGLTLPSTAPNFVVERAPGERVPVGGTELTRPPVEDRAEVKGTILFTRDGDIWAASGTDARRLTSNRSDSAPTWSHDGRHIYFVRTTARETSKARFDGKYTLYLTDIMRMDADGSNKKAVKKSIINDSRGQWFSHILQPDISPDGKTLAVVSDGPDGAGPVKLHLLPAKGGNLKSARASSVGDLGHNDPEWSPDGRRIAFTHNRAQGTEGAPVIAVYQCKTKKNCTQGSVSYLKRNYANPSWSPGGEWLAAEKTTGSGRDIVIVSADKGNERARLTTDGDSFAPVVSPDGDQIAYLHRDGVDIDLRVMQLDLSDGTITLVQDRAVTSDGGIDAISPPAWYIPKSELTPRDETSLPVEAPLNEETLGVAAP